MKKALELDGVAAGATSRSCGATTARATLVLHGAARAAAAALGARELALSMSHEGDYATAVVVAACEST